MRNGAGKSGCHEMSVHGGLQLVLDQSQWIPGCGGWNIRASPRGGTAVEMSKAGPTQKNSCRFRDFFIPRVVLTVGL